MTIAAKRARILAALDLERFERPALSTIGTPA